MVTRWAIDLDCLGRSLVKVLAQRAIWFRFVADPRQLAGALSLHIGVRHGPGARPAHRPAHQIRQR